MNNPEGLATLTPEQHAELTRIAEEAAAAAAELDAADAGVLQHQDKSPGSLAETSDTSRLDGFDERLDGEVENPQIAALNVETHTYTGPESLKAPLDASGDSAELDGLNERVEGGPDVPAEAAAHVGSTAVEELVSAPEGYDAHRAAANAVDWTKFKDMGIKSATQPAAAPNIDLTNAAPEIDIDAELAAAGQARSLQV